MKMQNTEMEFVTFDAQDVIATSGGLSAMLITVEQGYNYNESDYASPTDKLLSLSKKELSSENSSHVNVKDKWIYYYSDQTGDAFYVADTSSLDKKPTDAPAGYYFETMEDIAAIGAWISKYKLQ